MKRLNACGIFAVLFTLFSAAGFAQTPRDFHTERVVLDNDSTPRYFYYIQTPPGMTGNDIFNLPIPPPGNPLSGFVYRGVNNGDLLEWDSSSVQNPYGAWVPMRSSSLGLISGSGSAGQVAYWNGATSIAGTNSFYWDNASGALDIGNQSSFGTLDVLQSGGRDVALGGGANTGAEIKFLGVGNYISLYDISGPLVFANTSALAQTNVAGTALMSLSPSGSLTITNLGSGVVQANSGALSTANVNLTNEVTGTLPIGNGGTGTAAAPFAAQLLIAQSATAYAPESMSGDATITSGGVVTVTWPVPGTIGSTTPNTGAFTALSAAGAVNINISGAGATTIGGVGNTVPIAVNDSIDFTKPIDLSGVTGAAGQVLTSAGAGATPTWTTALSPTSGVQYNVTSAQNSATTGTNDLFNVAYNTNNLTAAGALINSTTGATTGTAKATGLTLTAQASGGANPTTTTGLIASATGDLTNVNSANFGVLGAANASSSQIASFISTFPNIASGLPGPLTLPFGAGIVGYNPHNGDNQYAGFFYGTNTDSNGAATTGVLRAINNVPGNLPDGVQPSAAFFDLTDDGDTKAWDGNPAAPVGMNAGVTSTAPNSVPIAGLMWGTTYATGRNGTQAVGALGIGTTQYSGAAAADANVVGVEAEAEGDNVSTYDLIGLKGMAGFNNAANNTPMNIGGYCIAINGSSTNVGIVGQAGGTGNDALNDAALTGKNIAVVGRNTGGAASDYAGYFEGAVNLGGTTSPLQLNGSAGTSGQVLTSAGSGATPTWTTALSPTSGVQYNVTAAQNAATYGSHNLFDVAYNTTSDTAAGAVITATSAGTNVSATGLTVSADAGGTAGGTVTGVTASAQNGGASAGNATLGIVGLANAATFALPIAGQSSYQDASTDISGGGSAVVGYNITDADNQFAGYFYGNKTNKNTGSGDATGVLTAINDIRSAIVTSGGQNAQPAAGLFRSYDNTNVAASGSPAAVPTAVYAESYSASQNSQVQGVLAHAVTTAAGHGTMAAGLFSYTVGNNAAAATNARVIGVGGWADASNKTSNYDLLGVVGGTDPYGSSAGGAVPISVGGYFIGQSAKTGGNNLGAVAQVGGLTYQGWEDAAFTGKNVALAAINYNAASSTNLAAYFGGNVEITAGVAVGAASPGTNDLLDMKDGHIRSEQTIAPTTTTNANAGTGASSSVSNATDIAGLLTLTTGTAAWAGGTQTTVNFNKAYNVAPVVVVTPENATTASLMTTRQIYVQSSTSGFTLDFGSAETASTSYNLFYYVIETQ